MHKCHAPGSARFLRDRTSAPLVDGLEGLFPALVQDARQIDREIGAGERGRDPVLVLHIAAKQLDLAHVAHGWQVVRIVRTADDGPDTVALSGEAPDDMATQEAR